MAEVAQTLSRSKGWVSMRRRLLDEMSPFSRVLCYTFANAPLREGGSRWALPELVMLG
ncbi:MAG: hypothetical protein ACLQNE_44910 [Thermoguttaceae bacterium]